MPSELITLHLGKCGNQVGAAFWKKLCLEHGLDPNGDLKDASSKSCDRKEIFFNQVNDKSYKARAVLLDLRPNTVDSIKSSLYGKVYNDENIFVGNGDFCEVGKNWSAGFSESAKMSEDIFEILNREAELSDRLEGFVFTHSIAGRTGSGMSSFLLERLTDYYPKTIIQTFSIFPDQEDCTNDGRLHPYNAVVALSRLTKFANCVVSLDNAALHKMGVSMDLETFSYLHMNELVSSVMASTFLPLRYPTYTCQGLIGLVASLIPSHQLHYLIPGYYPLSVENKSPRKIFKTSAYEVMKQLLHHKNWMISNDEKDESKHCFISLLNIIQGESDPSDVTAALGRILGDKLVEFTTWAPPNIKALFTKSSSYIHPPYRVSGLMLANHTRTSYLIEKTISKYVKTKERSVGHHAFGREQFSKDELLELEQSLSDIEDLRDEYKAASSSRYLEWAKATQSLNKSSS